MPNSNKQRYGWRKFLILFFLIVLSGPQLIACSCPDNAPTFCETNNNQNVIALVKVLKIQGNYMQVELIENLQHHITSDTFEILGQDGQNCNILLWNFAPSDTVIFGFQFFTVVDTIHFDTTDVTYCGKYYLFVENDIVRGPINPNSSEMPYSQFKDQLGACVITSADELITSNPTQTYPNPAQHTFHVQADTPIELVTIFNSWGQLVKIHIPDSDRYNVEIEISDLPEGIYIVESKRNGTISRSRLVRLD